MLRAGWLFAHFLQMSRQQIKNANSGNHSATHLDIEWHKFQRMDMDEKICLHPNPPLSAFDGVVAVQSLRFFVAQLLPLQAFCETAEQLPMDNVDGI